MIPIKFPESNVIFAANQPEYQPLPAWKNEGGMGEVVSCWKLSFKERITILFTGKLWVSLCAFGKPLTPSYFSTKKTDVLITIKHEDK